MNNKFKKLLISMKKNKLLTVLIILIFLIIILCIVAVKVLIFPSYKVDKYGDRLDNIDSVYITDNVFQGIKNEFGEIADFEINKFELSGKIVNIYINVGSSIDVATVKSNADRFISLFSEDKLSYYDFQVFVTGEDENKYPMIGYKNKNSEGLYWNYEGEFNEE